MDRGFVAEDETLTLQKKVLCPHQTHVEHRHLPDACPTQIIHAKAILSLIRLKNSTYPGYAPLQRGCVGYFEATIT